MNLSPRANLQLTLHHQEPDHVPYDGEGAWRLVDYSGRKPPHDGIDEWGVTWAPLPESYVAGSEEPADSFPAVYPARTAADLLARGFPAPPGPDRFAGLFDGSDAQGQRPMTIAQHPSGLLDRFIALLGMHAAMTALLAEPEASHAVLARIADYHVGISRAYLKAGAEAGWLADDYAGTAGPYVRPELWRRMILPELKRVIAAYREAGAPVFFHTCGRADVFVADLLDAGVTALNLESSACDLAALKARFGRSIAFFGGISSEVMLSGRREDVRMAVRAAIIALGAGGGLILAPDQPLAYPAENVAEFEDAARLYGGRQAES
jgi:hypothetical protein